MFSFIHLIVETFFFFFFPSNHVPTSCNKKLRETILFINYFKLSTSPILWISLKKKKHRKKNDTHCTEYVNIHIIIKIFHQTFLHLSIIVFIIKTHHYKIKIKHSKASSLYYLKSILPNIHNSIVRNILTISFYTYKLHNIMQKA